MQGMSENNGKESPDPMKDSYPDVTDLTSQPQPPVDYEEDYESYRDWAEQEPQETEPYPHTFELNEAATERKAKLEEQMTRLLERLASDKVSTKGHYSPGGEAEVVTEMRKIQLAELPRIYADIRYESDYLQWHTRQETESWCQLASLQNSFRALGDESISQDDIAQAVGIHREGRPFPDDLRDFAQSKGYRVQTMESGTQMIDALANGSKVVLETGYPASPVEHTVLVSGIRIDHGKIEFICNDPALDQGAKPVGLARMLELLEPPLAHNKLTRSYAVSRGSNLDKTEQ
jgi:hypothetical protein